MTLAQTIPTTTSRRVKIIGAVAMLIVLLVSAEIAASAFYYLVVKPQLDATKAEPGHYYRASDNPRLVYELIPGYRGSHDGRDLHINSLGLRGPELSAVKDRPRIAILGDSVTFGIWHADAEALPHLTGVELQNGCGRGAEVLNLGVPGYGAQEIREQFQVKSAATSPDAAVYLLNLNDFARRETPYEGADAGLYRMYHPPLLKLPFFIRKVAYRFEKGTLLGGMNPTLQWYRWLIGGTSQQTFDDIAAMAAFAKSRGISFAVFVLPSGLALEGGTNALADEHKAIAEALQARGITVASDASGFISTPSLFDPTDHLTGPGNHLAAAELAMFIRRSFPGVAARMNCQAAGVQ
ncbi:SGNH/GDSL hydrolase family protein [Rhodopseudomonas palustris]|uniref:SGNH/GDSL hydrolase family protein n=1 Tax=Rhodopseudomonas palustris TaxID=1076 RepID=UPI001057C369|nr:SGNH/GDSL hydrolase family protein [Rhodopseudomonas palustris]